MKEIDHVQTNQGGEGDIFIGSESSLGGQMRCLASELEIGYFQIESIQIAMNQFIYSQFRVNRLGDN